VELAYIDPPIDRSRICLKKLIYSKCGTVVATGPQTTVACGDAPYAGPLIVFAGATETTTMIRISFLREVVTKGTVTNGLRCPALRTAEFVLVTFGPVSNDMHLSAAITFSTVHITFDQLIVKEIFQQLYRIVAHAI